MLPSIRTCSVTHRAHCCNKTSITWKLHYKKFGLIFLLFYFIDVARNALESESTPSIKGASSSDSGLRNLIHTNLYCAVDRTGVEFSYLLCVSMVPWEQTLLGEEYYDISSRIRAVDRTDGLTQKEHDTGMTAQGRTGLANGLDQGTFVLKRISCIGGSKI